MVLRTIERLVNDPFQPLLRTHKLSGQLAGLWACGVEYDCRIIFFMETDKETGDDDIIVLINIGTHDEVY